MGANELKEPREKEREREKEAKEPKRERRRVSEVAGQLGKISIAEEVITTIAELAVAEVKGLGEVKGSLANQVARVFGGRAKGVETTIEDDSVRFALKVSLRYGQPIPEVAQEIQRAVAQKVEEMTGLRVSGVDIYVQELELPQEEPVEKEKEG